MNILGQHNKKFFLFLNRIKYYTFEKQMIFKLIV